MYLVGTVLRAPPKAKQKNKNLELIILNTLFIIPVLVYFSALTLHGRGGARIFVRACPFISAAALLARVGG